MSLRDNFVRLTLPWAEAHGYRPWPLRGLSWLVRSFMTTARSILRGILLCCFVFFVAHSVLNLRFHFPQRCLFPAAMTLQNRDAQIPFTTKDGSTIRSLLDRTNAPVQLQSLA